MLIKTFFKWKKNIISMLLLLLAFKVFDVSKVDRKVKIALGHTLHTCNLAFDQFRNTCISFNKILFLVWGSLFFSRSDIFFFNRALCTVKIAKHFTITFTVTCTRVPFTLLNFTEQWFTFILNCNIAYFSLCDMKFGDLITV